MAAFVAVAEERHFGRAAARLGTSQPRVSTMLRRLEDLVGAELVERRPAVRLTPDGEAAFPHFKSALARSETGIQVVQRRRAGIEGTLRLGFPTWVLATGLPDTIVEFRSRYPAITLELLDLSSEAQIEGVRRGGLGLGFVRSDPFEDESVVLEKWFDEPWLLVLPASHSLAAKRSIGLDKLRSEPFVGFPEKLAPAVHRQVRSLFVRAGFEPRVVHEAAEWLAIVGLVRAGAGCAVVPACVERLYSEGLAYVAIAGPPVLSTVCICAPRTAEPATNLLKALVEGRR